MSLTVDRKQLKTGGGATALDGIDGAILLNLDECTVYESGVAYTYILNATSGAADDGLNTIAPDTNPGTKRWILQDVVGMSSKANRGAESLKIWTYTHTITAAEKAANEIATWTITAVTLTKVRSVSWLYYGPSGSQVLAGDNTYVTYLVINPNTNLNVVLGVLALENGIISVTIIEAA